MSVSDTNKNRGTHGDSSFMLGGLPSSSENPPALAVGSVKICPKCGGIVFYDSYHHAYVCNRSDCDYCEPKKPTNYERLISMTPAEMSEFLGEITNDGEEGLCPAAYCKCTERGCAGCWLDWLIEEAEE